MAKATEQSMSSDEFVRRIMEICPNAQIELDNDGQLVVYTNMRYADEYGRTVVNFDTIP